MALYAAWDVLTTERTVILSFHHYGGPAIDLAHAAAGFWFGRRGLKLLGAGRWAPGLAGAFVTLASALLLMMGATLLYRFAAGARFWAMTAPTALGLGIALSLALDFIDYFRAAGWP